MIRLYSKGCEYAIRGLMHFPDDIDSNVTVQEISERANIPEHFTRKMFQVLAREGILTAITGPKGGYKLARRADQISLLNIIEVIDGVEALDACVLGFPVCDNKVPCALHDAWVKAKNTFAPDFRRKSLADLAKARKKDQLMRSVYLKRRQNSHS